MWAKLDLVNNTVIFYCEDYDSDAYIGNKLEDDRYIFSDDVQAKNKRNSKSVEEPAE